MTSVPLQLTGPADDTRRAHGRTKEALRAAVGRTADLLRHAGDGTAAVPGLTWTAAETAAHMVGDLREYAQALARHTGGYLTHPNPAAESPSQMSAVVNANHLAEVPERDMSRLADMLEDAASTYLAAADTVSETATIPTANGLVLSPPTMTCLLLGEQAVHGLDIARAARRRWRVEPSDAMLIVPGVLTVAPQYLRRSAADARVSFELRIRGVNNYRMAVTDGAAVVTGATVKSDCVISADPVAFLLLGYGRIGQWSPVLRGRLRAGGRKPWLAMKFATLISSP